jgi:hypothetical protein
MKIRGKDVTDILKGKQKGPPIFLVSTSSIPVKKKTSPFIGFGRGATASSKKNRTTRMTPRQINLPVPV